MMVARQSPLADNQYKEDCQGFLGLHDIIHRLVRSVFKDLLSDVPSFPILSCSSDLSLLPLSLSAKLYSVFFFGN